MTKPAKHTSRLTRQDWIDTAFDMLISEGIAAVSIDRLANTLKITRGSFYHHFSDRKDLLQELLDYWAQKWTYDIRDQVANLGLDPSTTLFALMKAIRMNKAADFDAPFRAWALHDPMAREVVSQVDETRLSFIQSLFEAMGFAGLDADNRARLFLNYEAAAPGMFYTLTKEKDEELLVERHRFLTMKH